MYNEEPIIDIDSVPSPIIRLAPRADNVEVPPFQLDSSHETKSDATFDPLTYIKATSLYNFMMKDPIIDWLGHMVKLGCLNAKLEAVLPNATETLTKVSAFYTKILEIGVQFELTIMARITAKLPVTTIITDPTQMHNPINKELTTAAMQRGDPIIYQAALYNHENKTYGIPDLLVRSDYLNKICNTFVKYDKYSGCRFSRDWHYCVVDIKCTTLYLRADGEYILNIGSFPAYKAQLRIYTEALGLLQEYKPRYAYIIGRRYKYTCKGEEYRNYDALSRMGTIDYANIDREYIEQTQSAINWIRRLRLHGHEWNITPRPTVDELYPNMSANSENPFNTIKTVIAHHIDEITLLWQCGFKNRNKAFIGGIRKWSDQGCNAEFLGHTSEKYIPIINKIIHINRAETDSVILPKRLNSTLPKAIVEFYVDFETVTDVFANITDTTYLFMIGVGYIVNYNSHGEVVDPTWHYESFTTPNIADDIHEYNIFVDFHDYIQDILQEHHATNSYAIYHWSYAELAIYERIYERYMDKIAFPKSIDVAWVDLLDVFKQEQITIKGAFNYSLKTIAKAMHEHGMIDTKWEIVPTADDTTIVNGLSAMVHAVECSKQAVEQKIDMCELPIMQKIIAYNEVDCKVMMEILRYLREHLTGKKRRRHDHVELM